MGHRQGAIRWLFLWCGLLLAPNAAAQAREPGFDVALHARSTRSSARAEQVAWLSLTVPLDALARPVARRVAASTEPERPSATVPEPAPMPDGAPAALSFAQLRELSELARRAAAVALGVAGVPAERRRLDGLSTRARASAALPELKLRVQRNTDQALRWAPTSDDPYRVTQADGAGTTLEASATFHLDRLLFAREELNIEKERQAAAKEHLELERRVLEHVLGVFVARQLACADDVTTEQRAQQLLRIAGHFTELDAMTAGWFGEQAPGLSRAVWAFPEAILGQCSAPAAPPAPASTKPVATAENSG
jgi:hypothetical protein